MEKKSSLKLAQAALLTAICVGSQFFKNLSVFVTGPIVNICLILCVLYVGIGWAVILSVVSPVTSFIITGSPIMQAIPAIIPAVMIGNIIFVAAIGLINYNVKNKAGLPCALAAGTILKGLFMGAAIAMFLLPNFLPEPMMPKLKTFQMTFSVVQLATAAIGSVFAYIINFPLSKTVKK